MTTQTTPAIPDPNKFDFIRAWYARLGQRPVSVQEFTERIDKGELPNLVSVHAPATTDKTAIFLKTLLNGAVVAGKDIVDVVLNDGAYRAVQRLPERGDTINPK